MTHAVGLILILFAGATLVADDRAETVLRSAMGPYYAALASSSRGNVEATHRQVLLFVSRWERAARQARTDAPPELRNDAGWGKAIDDARASLNRARDRAVAGDVAGAHAELEAFRMPLREIRGRHNLLTVDDRVTDFHDAMERLVGRAGGRNEIQLTPADFDGLQAALASAKTAWGEVETAAASEPKLGKDWGPAASAIGAALDRMADAIVRRASGATGAAAETVNERYLELLLVLAGG
jgi:hypothetical protein